MGTRTKTPWGRRIQEDAGVDAPLAKSAWGRQVEPREPTVVDFCEVGLSEADAAIAAAGLANGTYLSFEDACLSTVMNWPKEKRVVLDEARMRAKARVFVKLNGL